jgi:hypothetical protein
MDMKETLVDTCFLHKISNEGKEIEVLKKVINALGIKAVVHPYIAKHELELHSSYKMLIEEGFIKVIGYNDIFKSTVSQIAYEGYLQMLYDDFHKTMDVENAVKAEKMYSDLKKIDVFESHKQGSSLGDVHMMLTAAFLNIPMILTEDSDIEILRDISNRRIKYNKTGIKIINAIDAIKIIVSDNSNNFAKKDIDTILNVMKERSKRAEIKKLWDDAHSVDN